MSRSSIVRYLAVLSLVLTLVAGTFSVRGVAAQDTVVTEPPASEEPVSIDEPSTEPVTDPVATEPVATEPVATEPVVEASTEPVVTEEPVVETSAEPVATGEPVDPADIDGDAGTDSGTGTGTGADSDSIYTIAEDIIEVRVRLEAGVGNQGTTEFFQSTVAGIPGFPGFPGLPIDDLGTAAVGDSQPLAGATIEVRVAETNDLIDAVTTGPNGLIYLDAPVREGFYLRDTATGSVSAVTGFIEPAFQGRFVFTATRYVQDDQVPDSGNDAYVIAQDAVEIRTRVQECPAGQTPATMFAFLLQTSEPICDNAGIVIPGPGDPDLSAAQVDDSRPASFTVGVFIADTNEQIDVVTTDAGGIGLLDIPVGVEFVIRDLGTLDQSPPFAVSAEVLSTGRGLVTVTRAIPVVPGGNVGPDGTPLPYAIAEDFIELRARFQQDPSGDGLTFYIPGIDFGVNDTFTNGESIPAAGVTFTVYDEAGRIVDEATTDADGVVLLDAPIDIAFEIIEDYNGQSSGSFLPLELGVSVELPTITRLIFSVTMFVADLDDIASPDASASAPVDASASASAVASASASAVASASASAVASASAAPSFPPFEGEVIEGGAIITGTISEDDDLAGTYEYYYDLVGTLADGDIRYAGEGEQYYYVAVLVGDEYQVVDEGPTDANGMVTLDIPADEPYFIFEENDYNDPFGSDFIEGGQPASFFVVEYVAGADASVAPSAAPSTGGGDDNGGTDGGTTGGGTAAGGGATALPNTGAGANDAGMTMTWALFALMAVAGVAAAGFGLRRRAA